MTHAPIRCLLHVLALLKKQIPYRLSWSLSAGVIESSKNAHEHFQPLRGTFLLAAANAGAGAVISLEAEIVGKGGGGGTELAAAAAAPAVLVEEGGLVARCAPLVVC